MIKLLSGKFLETITNQVLTLDPHHYSFLERHSGKVIEIAVTDLNQSFFYIIRPEKIYVYTNYSEQPDTKITSSLILLLKQLSATSEMSGLRVEGDLDIANDLRTVIQKLEINLEEYLAFVIGDFPAAKLGSLFTRIKHATINTQKRTLEDFKDYIQEEKRYFPTREEVEDFYEDLALIRQDIDRLEARLDRIVSKSIK